MVSNSTPGRTHSAVVTIAPRAPLAIMQVPTIPPGPGEVLVRVQYTASTPLDLHQADGGLLVKHPQVMGSGMGGVVVEVGAGGHGTGRLRAGDVVFGYTFREQKEKAHQEFVTVPEFLLAKVSA